MPTTLAIQGEWGSGKTSLMNQIRYRLCSNENDGKPYYGVWINTWQYSLMRDPNEIILNIIEGVTSEVVKIIKEKNSPFVNESLHKLSTCFRSVAKVGAKVAATSVGLSASVIDDILSEKNIGSNQFAFRDSFENAIKRCIDLDKDDSRIQNKKAGFLFFIDDLDRIEPSLAVKLLEILKNLFEVEYCFFILAIDYDVVVKGLIPRFGEMTEKNEREFRSFFDKIVQLPFTMPTAAYAIGDYVGNSLQQIGFLDKKAFGSAVSLYLDEGQKDIPVSDAITTLVENSTGTNPRSIKRLINTLSLIKIITQAEENSIDDSMSNKLVFFGLVCIQISYPSLYSLLYKEPNFLQWNNDFVRSCGIKSTDDAEEENDLFERNGLEEEWEKSVYRICTSNKYLMRRIFNIVKLLNFIKSLSTDEEKLEECISSLIGLTSITSVDSASSNDNVLSRTKTQARIDSLDAMTKFLADKGFSEFVINIMNNIFNEMIKIFGNNVRPLFSGGHHHSLAFISEHPKSRKRVVNKIWMHKSIVYMGSNGTLSKILSMDDFEKIKETFFKGVIIDYNKITVDEFKMKID